MSNGMIPNTNKELKNDFREELAKKQDPIKFEADRVGEEEMLRRDQYATMIHLEHEQVMRDCDVAHLKAAIQSYTDFLEELKRLPLCEGREGTIQVVEQQIQRLEKQLAQSVFPRVNVVSLEALRSVFRIDGQRDKETEAQSTALSQAQPIKETPDTDDEDELTAPENDLEEEAI